jgi:hypothetical protein
MSFVQTGFNHNIRHQGKLYHVQTEDLGQRNPWVVSHVFFEGAVVGSIKSSYADRLGAPDLSQQVMAQMQRQHKEALRNVVQGQYDAPQAPVAPPGLSVGKGTADPSLDEVVKAFFDGQKK